jgi:dimethylaniline monooxygenase (N-oxide forming)
LYASLKTNISKQMMSLSDFPFPDDYPNFPSHPQVLDYISAYTQKHQLEGCISLGEKVSQVSFSDDSFIITTNTQTIRASQLIVSTGRFEVPQLPAVPGMDTFPGIVLHSKEYDTPDPFRDKNVLIVGAASSAMDIAAELYGEAASVAISVRNLPWIIPTLVDGKPTDHALTWLKARLPKKVREMGYKKILLKEYIKRGADPNPATWAIKMPPVDLDRTRFVPNEKMISLLIEQRIQLHPEVSSVHQENVYFNDHTSKPVDAIVFATGYQTRFPFFEKAKVPVKDNYLGLYKHVFHPEYPNLAFIGMATIVGAAFPLVEMQSRFIAEVFSKKIRLPTPYEMQKSITAHKSWCDQAGIDPMRVQALSYLDELAAMIKVSPRFTKNREVWRELVFGPLTAFRFRLNGPDSKAEEAKRNVKKSILR